VSRIVLVSYTKTIDRCQDCPHFHSHPQEPTCGKLTDIDDPWASLLGWNECRDGFPSKCPLSEVFNCEQTISS